MKKEYPITFIYKASSHKFEASIIGNNPSDFDFGLGLGDTIKEATDDLLKTMNDFTPYTWKYVKKPKLYLIRE